ncbi:MAG: bifunctional phosphoribosylaminoimidazolecarboxamide formyltransferase/IMP cyclohydrolase [Bacteroidota bacterium]
MQIKSALISVYHKQGLEPIIAHLQNLGVQIYSTGGTASYIEKLGVEVHHVEDLTGYPSILGGRVKTLHPKVHGGILARRDVESDQKELATYEIPTIDLVIVDLYPFEETVRSGASEEAIIEKIDIGGIALIRAAAKNFKDVVCVASQDYYDDLVQVLDGGKGEISLEQRKYFAGGAFDVSSHYDAHIFQYLKPNAEGLKISYAKGKKLRYGENPHQTGLYYGDLSEQFEQLHGKELSYNNLVDIEGALEIVDEFDQPCFAVIKHTNPCGCAVADNLLDAWKRALEGDPISAFGGILACNGTVDKAIAEEIHPLFFEVLIAKDFTPEAFELLTHKKKNRRLLKRTADALPAKIVKSMVSGFLVQDKDRREITAKDLEVKSSRKPTEQELKDVLFGDKVCKHLKSNAIAIVKNEQLIGSGMGQTSRIDALKHAMQKAEEKGFDLDGAVLASDAFFPFSDCVEMAHNKGIEVVVEPGGSVRDQETIDFCETHNMCLIFTSVRHFKH